LPTRDFLLWGKLHCKRVAGRAAKIAKVSLIFLGSRAMVDCAAQ
jgi:hypothetical protein